MTYLSKDRIFIFLFGLKAEIVINHSFLLQIVT